MKNFLLMIAALLLFGIPTFAQTEKMTKPTAAQTDEDKPKRQIFRANKDQISQVQKMLKMTEIGKLDNDTRAAIKKYQSESGLKMTGTLNRATLEKMNVALTDKQKEIPVSPNSFAGSDAGKAAETKKRAPVFRANKEQVMKAQKMLKVEETGKLDDTTRDGLKTYQKENKLKVTGTLNQATLEKMSIELTDKQKENAKMKNED